MKTDIDDLNYERQQKNARFRKANKAKKRVMIAKDVLSQLGSRMFAKHRVWVEDPGLLEKGACTSIEAPSASTEVCDVTSKLKTCNVCGIGALFVSAVEFADKLKIGELSDYYPSDDKVTQLSVHDLWAYLGKFFSEEQLNMIECAFEDGEGQIGASSANDSHMFLRNLDIDDPGERMRLIMENIVINDGTFVPTVFPMAKTIYVTPGYKG